MASKEYGRQICPGRLVVQPQGHQRHWLDDAKAILEAPTKKIRIARRHDDARSSKGLRGGYQCLEVQVRLVSATACPKKASTVAYPVIRSLRSTITAVPPFMASASSPARSCP